MMGCDNRTSVRKVSRNMVITKLTLHFEGVMATVWHANQIRKFLRRTLHPFSINKELVLQLLRLSQVPYRNTVYWDIYQIFSNFPNIKRQTKSKTSR